MRKVETYWISVFATLHRVSGQAEVLGATTGALYGDIIPLSAEEHEVI